VVVVTVPAHVFALESGKVVQTAETHLTIPGLFKDQRDTFRIQTMGDDPTVLWVEPGGMMMTCADGGGFGYSGGVNASMVPEDSTSTVDISISYHWDNAEQKRGSLDQHVLVKIGTPADVPLTGGGRLVVTWRPEASHP
jgi:hypothetical protein